MAIGVWVTQTALSQGRNKALVMRGNAGQHRDPSSEATTVIWKSGSNPDLSNFPPLLSPINSSLPTPITSLQVPHIFPLQIFPLQFPPVISPGA